MGILAGCAKKPTETVSGSTETPPGPTGGAKPADATNKGGGRGDLPGPVSTTPQGGTDWTVPLPVVGKKPDLATSNTPPKASTPSTPIGEVGVVQCRFDGVEKAIADAKGKVVLIDCWAQWCPPCVASFPKLVEKHQKYGAKGLAVISLSTDKVVDSPKVIAFLKKNNATFTNLHMPMDAAAQQGLIDKFAFKGGIPHAVLFDRTGKRVWTGHPMEPKLPPLIEAELAKGGPSI